jgi:hypothetical protein
VSSQNKSCSIATINTGCEDDDPKEACEQDLFCDDTVEVTACCTDGEECYYTYGGIDYPDTDQGLLDLAKALDCAKSATKSEQNYIMAKLQALLESARQASK